MNIALIGYGKMGKAIEQAAQKSGHHVVCRIAKQTTHLLSTLEPKEVDVAIEFSHPQAAYENVRTCLQQGIPVIAGTTGWMDKKAKIVEYCKQQGGTFFYTTNFSLLSQLFFRINILLARSMQAHGPYTVTLSETHHLEKKDKPSGTALQLVGDILPYTNASGWSFAEDPQPDTIPITVHRKDDQVGTHAIHYSTGVESLSLTHMVRDRVSFAAGVIQVAAWMQGKKGVLTMDDFLGPLLPTNP